MTIYDRVRRWITGTTDPTAPSSSASVASSGISLASPWSAGSLESLVLSDIYGVDLDLPVTRAEGMATPAFARGRHMITAAISQAPLWLYAGETRLDGEAGWLQSTTGPTSPQHRMLWTVDDLMWSGWSLWLRRNDPNDPATILDAVRCPIEWWKFGERGAVLVNDQPVPADQVILIPGFTEGIITNGARTIRASRELEVAWANRAANPIPATELHHETDDELSPEEKREVVDDWRSAISKTGGAVVYTPRAIKVFEHGAAAGGDLLIQGRNAAAIDAARHLGIPAAMIDASNVNSTLTYETMQGRDVEFRTHTLSLYLNPITSRLSLDDVTRPGTRVAADTSQLTLPQLDPTGPVTKD